MRKISLPPSNRECISQCLNRSPQCVCCLILPVTIFYEPQRALLHCRDRELCPVCYAEFMHNLASMHLNSGLRHAELTCNYLIAVTLTKKSEHPLLFDCKRPVADRFVDRYFAGGQDGGRKKRTP